MNTTDTDRIRSAVRETYGRIAEQRVLRERLRYLSGSRDRG
jgi:hypothetical protein